MCFAIFDHHKFTDFNLKGDVAAYFADGVGMDVLCRAKRPEVERRNEAMSCKSSRSTMPGQRCISKIPEQARLPVEFR